MWDPSRVRGVWVAVPVVFAALRPPATRCEASGFVCGPAAGIPPADAVRTIRRPRRSTTRAGCPRSIPNTRRAARPSRSLCGTGALAGRVLPPRGRERVQHPEQALGGPGCRLRAGREPVWDRRPRRSRRRRASAVRTLPHAGGMPASSRGSERSADPRRTRRIDPTPRGVAQTADNRRSGPGQTMLSMGMWLAEKMCCITHAQVPSGPASSRSSLTISCVPSVMAGSEYLWSCVRTSSR